MDWKETVESIAVELGKSTSWVYKATSTGILPCIHIGGGLRFNKEEVWAHLADQRPKKRGRPCKGARDVTNQEKRQ